MLSLKEDAEDQRSLSRLIADLEKEANEEEAGTGQQTKVAAMFKAAASNEKIMAMSQASKTARPTNDDLIMCDRCGGRHHNRKCQFRGTCFDCGRRGHKACHKANTVAPRARKVDSLVPKTSMVIRKRDFKDASSIRD